MQHRNKFPIFLNIISFFPSSQSSEKVWAQESPLCLVLKDDPNKHEGLSYISDTTTEVRCSLPRVTTSLIHLECQKTPFYPHGDVGKNTNSINGPFCLSQSLILFFRLRTWVPG
ncbi:hypothetical protein TNIN_127201 [Trichonephila inaurata madagascariensis]|uniref:Uncharacterized protein n=1 Tax=Trichonephila inaurata madagascariensis TaxID=2747483 RepID=A0A8X6X0B3_9ARAC|nr:hypothetical protein TNIN_127201 [Trichonephila inaurata madagascariensis]